MDLLTRYCRVKDELDELTSEDAYNHDDCLWDIDGYYDCGIDNEGVLRERVEALENLAKAIERVKNLGLKYGGNSFVTLQKKQEVISLFEKGLSYRNIKKQIGDISLGSISTIIREKKIMNDMMNDNFHEVIC